jgi:hypothetical protein
MLILNLKSVPQCEVCDQLIHSDYYQIVLISLQSQIDLNFLIAFITYIYILKGL